LAAVTGTVPRRASPVWYNQIVRHVRDAVRKALPADALVLVISKGDDELLRLDGRRAWHFPRTQDGLYAGHHPVDSDAAIAHLEELRDAGARYLVIPAPSFWWLDFYTGFDDHLRSNYTLVLEEPETCLIFALSDGDGAGVRRDSPSGFFRQLSDYLDRLLPSDATVAVVSSGDARFLDLGGRRAIHFPHTTPVGGGRNARGDGTSDAEQLRALKASGASFLVIPHAASPWLERHPDFLPEAERRYRRVARQGSICTVLELGEGPGRERPRPGLGARFLEWLTRS
jgi:hypothetical protein